MLNSVGLKRRTAQSSSNQDSLPVPIAVPTPVPTPVSVPIQISKDNLESGPARHAAHLCLAASQKRPLRALHLWVLLQVLGHAPSHAEDLLVPGATPGDRVAAGALERLLGKGILLREEEGGGGEGDTVWVVRCDDEGREAGELDGLALATAHATLGRACMAICATTTRQLTHLCSSEAEDEDPIMGLIRYAWTYWPLHLDHARASLSAPEAAAMLADMASPVCADLLRVLLGLHDMLVKPVVFPVLGDQVRAAELVRTAQEVVIGLLPLVAELVRRTRGRSAHDEARDGSGLLALRPGWDQDAEGLCVLLVDGACGLRALGEVLRRRPLCDEVERLCEGGKGIEELLVRVGEWMESVASHFHENTEQKGRASPSRLFSPSSLSISRPRRAVASLVHALTLTQSQGAFAIKAVSTPPRLALSFGAFPIEAQGIHDPLEYLLRLALIPLRPLLSSLRFLSSLRRPRMNVAHSWIASKPALVHDGLRVAAGYCGVAIILNHVRRTMAPWLCAYLWYDPLEDLRLARSNPDTFLDEALSFSWDALVFMHVQKMACDWVAALLVHQLMADDARASCRAQPYDSAGYRRERLLEIARVVYLVWVLATTEYVIARAINTVSFSLALWKLLSGGVLGHTVLSDILRQHWAKFALVIWQLLFYAQNALWPLLHASVLGAAYGQLGLLLAVLFVGGSVRAIIKYRSTFFIALEVSGFFVALTFAGAVAVLLGQELLRDPLGFHASTATLRLEGAKAREVLSLGWEAQNHILVSERDVPAPPRPNISAETSVKEGLGGSVRRRHELGTGTEKAGPGLASPLSSRA